MINVQYSKHFKKQFRKLPPKMQQQFKERLKILLRNPQHPTLNIHALKGQYVGCFSMNVSGDIRAIFRRKSAETTLLFLLIGAHSKSLL